MNFSNENSFWFFLIYLIFSRGLFWLFPTYVNKRFAPVPKLKYINSLDTIIFYGTILYSFFVPLSTNKYFIYTGFFVYLLGSCILIISIYQFAISKPDKIVSRGFYRISRHPVYLSFYLLFLGISISTESLIYFVLLLIHIMFQHQIIKQEEADLLNFYGQNYRLYCKQTKRYL